ncbi:mitochondrial import receptor subunit TOM40 homolog isoform X1 [Gallus gallus]|uniref:mitochondrial import receptor subunit TOM40 homolog isoform X1 n=1 Tax=Gallus gallus TaxID=9031 RepID=UPI001AE9D7B7|nr:mitochondrial import receptor subunit TOM40 homolog isoform X1 [Gallus gallus]
MGSVLAAGSPPPPPPPAVGLLPPPLPPPPGLPIAGGGGGGGGGALGGLSPTGGPPNGEGGATAALPNPGTFEECHRRCKELFPVQMEGVKLTVNKGLSNHFQVNHTVALSTVGDSAYHFGATYVGGQQIGPNEAFPVLVGSMDGSGSLSAQLLHLLTPACAPSWPARSQNRRFSPQNGDLGGLGGILGMGPRR